MSYQIRLDNFEGPFDLLLHLIEKNQVDIYDIPIAEITRQYVAYLAEMEALDLEIASSFLVMAANLLAIKARMLLPKPPPQEEEGEEDDARGELVRDLLEYKRYKEAALLLEDRSQEEAQYIPRPNEEEWYFPLFAAENPLEGKTAADLQAAFQQLLDKLENQEKIFQIEGREISVGEQQGKIRRALAEYPQGLPFGKIFDSCLSRIEMVVTFLALLELIKNHIVTVSQRDAFTEIYLYPRPSA